MKKTKNTICVESKDIFAKSKPRYNSYSLVSAGYQKDKTKYDRKRQKRALKKEIRNYY